MAQVTIVAEQTTTLDAHVEGGRVLVEPERLADAIGWSWKPEGLCRGAVCVPVRDPGALAIDGRLDIAAVAGALGRPSVVDADAGLVVVAQPAEARRAALEGLQAPTFALADLDGVEHRLEEWRGRKKLLVLFSSW